MNAKHLCTSLGITEDTLETLIADGLPWSGTEARKKFDNDEVVAWLVENDLAEPRDPNICKTAEEVAEALGVAPNSIGYWQKSPDFPWKQGYFPIDKIKDWLIAREAKKEEAKKESGPAELSVQDQIRQAKLEKFRGELVRVDEVSREHEKQVSLAVSELHTIAARFEAKMPASTPPELMRLAREAIQSSVDEAIKTVREKILADAEDKSEKANSN